MTRLARLLFATLLAVLATQGCETTGDPNAGGLFGWDKDKADARQRAYEDELDTVRSQRLEQEAINDELATELTATEREIAANNRSLAVLIREKKTLQTELSDLLATSEPLDAEETQLLNDIDTVTKQLATLEQDALSNPAALSNYERELKAQNQRYSDAIIQLTNQ